MFDEDLYEEILTKEKLKKSIKEEILDIEERSWRPFVEMLGKFVKFYDGQIISAKIGDYRIHGSQNWFIMYYVIKNKGLFGKKILKAEYNGMTESFVVECDPKYISLLKELYVSMSEMIEVKLESNVQKLEILKAKTELIHFGV